MIRQYSSWAKSSLFGVVLPLALCAVACSSSSDNQNTDKDDEDAGGAQPGDRDGGSNGGGGGDVPTAEQFCEHFAARVFNCDNRRDEQTTANQCKNSTAAALPKWRDDVVKPMDECVQKQDCATALSSKGIPACRDKAKASIAPTPATSEFCAALKKVVNGCDHGDVDEGGCLDVFKVYKDDTLDDMTKCTKDCHYESCILATGGVRE